jgi:hypothetical protein
MTKTKIEPISFSQRQRAGEYPPLAVTVAWALWSAVRIVVVAH